MNNGSTKYLQRCRRLHVLHRSLSQYFHSNISPFSPVNRQTKPRPATPHIITIHSSYCFHLPRGYPLFGLEQRTALPYYLVNISGSIPSTKLLVNVSMANNTSQPATTSTAQRKAAAFASTGVRPSRFREHLDDDAPAYNQSPEIMYSLEKQENFVDTTKARSLRNKPDSVLDYEGSTMSKETKSDVRGSSSSDNSPVKAKTESDSHSGSSNQSGHLKPKKGVSKLRGIIARAASWRK